MTIYSFLNKDVIQIYVALNSSNFNKHHALFRGNIEKRRGSNLSIFLHYENISCYLTLLIPGHLVAPQNRGKALIPLHNFPIYYAFALKLVTGVHQGLVNNLIEKYLMT